MVLIIWLNMNNFSKIHIYNRHFSRNRKHPQRPEWFDYEKCFSNLLFTTNFDLCDLTVVFEKEEDYDQYFIKKYENIRPFKVKFIDTAKEKWVAKTNEDIAWSRSIAAAAEVIKNDNNDENDLIYICDDDFLHVPYWAEISLDYIVNFLPKDGNWWLCPCDYGDKYFFIDPKKTIDQCGTNLGMYADLKSKVRISNYRHFRDVPNCLTSSIIPVKTFNRDYDQYWKTGYSDCSLCFEIKTKYNTEFWSPIPSLSCHTTYPFLSPLINWQEIQEKVKLS